MTPSKTNDQDRSFVTPPTRRSSPVLNSHLGSPASRMSRISPDSVPERQEKGPRPPIKPESPVEESVMVENRHTTEIDEGLYADVDIDRPGNGSPDDFKSFLQSMGEKAMQLEICGTSVRTRQLLSPLFGQCGLIVDEKQRYTLVTAAHNTASNSKEASSVTFVEVQKQRVRGEKMRWHTTTNHQGQDIAKARRLALGDTVSWPSGWDIDHCRVSIEDDNLERCWAGPLPWHKSSLSFYYQKDWAFRKASANFKYEEGQKIAIAVSSLGCTQQEPCNIFGPPGGVSIYTGAITKVGIDHIEHNINTFKGCSGAIIFLLEDVCENHRGTALAVHVGYHRLVCTNIGLKIARGYEPNLWEKACQLFRSLQLPPSCSPSQEDGEPGVKVATDVVTKTTESSDSDETGQDSTCSD